MKCIVISELNKYTLWNYFTQVTNDAADDDLSQVTNDATDDDLSRSMIFKI